MFSCSGPGEKLWHDHGPPVPPGPHGGHPMGPPPPPGGGHFGQYPPKGPYPYMMPPPPPHGQGAADSTTASFCKTMALLALYNRVHGFTFCLVYYSLRCMYILLAIV